VQWLNEEGVIRSDDPVLFIEHRGLYRTRGEIPAGDQLVPIGSAAVLRSGSDVTILALSKMVRLAMEAAEKLSSDGISAEVIDPRSICPLDLQTIVASVKKTGRFIVVHEAVEQGGAGAEIVARVQEEAFYYLDSPILRVAAPYAPVPFSPSLEKQFVPGKDQIIQAVRQSLDPAARS
jgi:pyruvate dehydrogenase E1 component beta subunit